MHGVLDKCARNGSLVRRRTHYSHHSSPIPEHQSRFLTTTSCIDWIAAHLVLIGQCMDESINAWMNARRSDNNGCGKLEASCVLDQCARNGSLVQQHQTVRSILCEPPILHCLDSCRTISYNVTLGKEIEWNECMALVVLPKSCECPFESIDVVPFPTVLGVGPCHRLLPWFCKSQHCFVSHVRRNLYSEWKTDKPIAEHISKQ